MPLTIYLIVLVSTHSIETNAIDCIIISTICISGLFSLVLLKTYVKTRTLSVDIKEKIFFYQLLNVFDSLFENESNNGLSLLEKKFMALPAKRKDKYLIRYNEMQKNVKIFLRYFCYLFISFLLLFVAMGLKELHLWPNLSKNENAFELVCFVINTFGALFIFLCFYVLYQTSEKHALRRFIYIKHFGIVLILFLTIFYASSLYFSKTTLKPGEILVQNTNKDETHILSDKKADLILLSQPQPDQETRENDSSVNLNLHYHKEGTSEEGVLKLNTSLFKATDIEKLLSISSHSNNPKSEKTLVRAHLNYETSITGSYFTTNPPTYLQVKINKNQSAEIIPVIDFGYLFSNQDTARYIELLPSDCFFSHRFCKDGALTWRFPKGDSGYFNTGYQVAFKTSIFSDQRLLPLDESQLSIYFTDNETFKRLFNFISGFLNAIALSLLIGRLLSKLIDEKKLLIVLLFFYPAIQPLYAFFDKDLIKLIAFLLALILKGLLFYVIYWRIIRQKKLHIYLFCFKELSLRSDLVFNNHFEITLKKQNIHHLTQGNLTHDNLSEYVLSIQYKNEIVFDKVVLKCDRESSISIIENLRTGLKSGSMEFRMDDIDGTFWLTLNTKEITLYSKGLKNSIEAEDFKEDAELKLAYCKVSFDVENQE
jgi:hypothetical protein